MSIQFRSTMTLPCPQIAALLICGGLGGCIAVPLPTVPHNTTEYGRRDLDFSKMTKEVTKREDVLQRLGEPDVSAPDHRWEAYVVDRVGGTWVGASALMTGPCSGPGTFAEPWGSSAVLLIAYSDDGRVREYSTLRERLQYSNWEISRVARERFMTPAERAARTAACGPLVGLWKTDDLGLMRSDLAGFRGFAYEFRKDAVAQDYLIDQADRWIAGTCKSYRAENAALVIEGDAGLGSGGGAPDTFSFDLNGDTLTLTVMKAYWTDKPGVQVVFHRWARGSLGKR
jgi:hypothetical protein